MEYYFELNTVTKYFRSFIGLKKDVQYGNIIIWGDNKRKTKHFSKSDMRFSVLIPVYNVEKFLHECIDSILQQNYDDYEIILIDDGSTDSSGNICNEYQKKNNKITAIHRKNKGLLYTRQEAFAYAKGDYCICVDSDDKLNDGSLTLLSRIIDESEPDFILYDLVLFDESSKRKIPKTSKFFFDNDHKYYDLQPLKSSILDQNYINWSMCCKCIKRELVQNMNIPDEYVTITYGEDTLQSIILYNRACNFVYTDAEIYFYRLKYGMTHNPPINKYLNDFRKISEYLRENCKNWSDNITLSADNYYFKIYVNYFFDACYKSKNFMEYRERINTIQKNNSADLKPNISGYSLPKYFIPIYFCIKNGWFSILYFSYKMVFNIVKCLGIKRN